MNDLMEKALATVQGWPPERQDEAAEILLDLDRLGGEPYRASDAEVVDAFSRFRR